MTHTQRVYTRYMIRRDIPEVCAIELQSFEGDAWKEEDFLKSLRMRNVLGNVAEQGDRVLGYMIYEMLKDSYRIANFAVDPRYVRQRVGTTMIDKLKGKLGKRGRERIVVDVAESNLIAQLFFRSQGFRCVKVLRNGCLSSIGYEDLYRMVYALPGNEHDPIPQNRIHFEELEERNS